LKRSFRIPIPNLNFQQLAFLLISFYGLFSSCTQVGVFEKNLMIPGHKWDSAFKPSIEFEIADTNSFYNIFLVVRHTDAYNFNNIWVKIRSKSPGDSIAVDQRFDLPLASQNQWTGTGMDDIFEHRLLLYNNPVKFKQPGTYKVTIEQVMRENPLQHVMNIGLRVEKLN